MARRRVAILGSTGSIGTQALDVIAANPERFEVVALAAGTNLALLERQARAFAPDVVVDARAGAAGLLRAATASGADIVLAATTGAVSLDAIFAAAERGIDLAVANKEAIVAAGELLVEAVARGGGRLLPVDSEHSALFQCLVGEDRSQVAALLITASGGPFRSASAETIAAATLEEALNHPTWRMGTKNTIDSATLMNKGLEAIEAARLFSMPAERVLVVVHPQSLLHGAVLFSDGSVKAQLCAPDMRVPIGYALAYPDRLGRTPLAMPLDPLALLGAKPNAALLRYDYERVDTQRFPSLALAYDALRRGGCAPAVLSAANEIAVEAFVAGAIAFGDIPTIVGEALEGVPAYDLTLPGLRSADGAARAFVRDRLAVRPSLSTGV
ncbi:MAG: 1-deoxy-D-xylulose-5-phosphate reductoisomerase [Candidatus Eremiobacteraeota bacterium]|nr:1-deoxy-D-xylulose-5-phosphate reductoisomerase [Candidatus Eremiobacteraeota bacterium]NNM92706.1 1-deoxy-D-xylulose-5-phosphate reductoisomerase [Candidatus Eremiobacteraeota bacterium]